MALLNSPGRHIGRINCHQQWRHVDGRLYAMGARGRWDGDDSGNEWPCGFAIFPSDDGHTWELYEDDGEGNGNMLAECPTIWDAALAAEAVDAGHGPEAWGAAVLDEMEGKPH